jgi:hypothetical protein
MESGVFEYTYDNKKPVYLVPIRKYAEIITNKAIKNKIDFSHIDFSKKVNIFYGFKDSLFELIEEIDFINYPIICRLVNWKHENYQLRFLKTDKNDIIDFDEEQIQINSHIYF